MGCDSRKVPSPPPPTHMAYDIMSSDLNVMKDEFGKPFKHFTSYSSPFSAEVNVFSQRLENEK